MEAGEAIERPSIRRPDDRPSIRRYLPSMDVTPSMVKLVSFVKLLSSFSVPVHRSTRHRAHHVSKKDQRVLVPLSGSRV